MPERDTKPWAGQLYLSHAGEPTCKLLYKKFYKKIDTTILHGYFKHILLSQNQRPLKEREKDSNEEEDLSRYES